MTIIRTTRSSKRTSQSQTAPQPPPASNTTPDSQATRQPSPSYNPPAKKPRPSQQRTTASELAIAQQHTEVISSASPSSSNATTEDVQSKPPGHSRRPPSTSNPTSFPSPTVTLNVSEAPLVPVPASKHSRTPVRNTATTASTTSSTTSPSSSGKGSTTPKRPSYVSFAPINYTTSCDASSALPLPATCTTPSFPPTKAATTSHAPSPHTLSPTFHLQPSPQTTSGTVASSAVDLDASSLPFQSTPGQASIPAPSAGTSLLDNTSSETEPGELVEKPRTTAYLVCPSSEIEQASIVRLDPWVPIDVLDRIYKLCDYTDLSSTSFSIANIPSSATWGSKYACMDRSTYLCIDNEPIVAWVTGPVAKKWFSDYQGQPQSPVKLAVNPARSIDLAAAHYWLGRGTGSKAPTSDAVWASKLMLEWSADPDVEKPDVIRFTNIFDATDMFSCQDDLAQKTPRFFRVGDIVLMEFHIMRYKPKGSKSTTWNSFQVGFELVAIDVIARNPAIMNAADATSHSPIKRRMVNI